MLGAVAVPDHLLSVFRPAKVVWGKGMFGPLVGKLLESSANVQAVAVPRPWRAAYIHLQRLVPRDANAATAERLIGTALSVIIGVAFLAGTFVFTDTIQRTFDNLFADVYANTDAYVRSNESIEVAFAGTQRSRIPDSVIAEVAAVPGVAVASGDCERVLTGVDLPGPLGAVLVDRHVGWPVPSELIQRLRDAFGGGP